ncbi:prepilin peptidase [Atopococcus tabaci]|uniref:prepilin peptidase n=1 Tax=Atopococcus tabaci TaxID=269774 RepID=UPI000405DA17|nr:A24 family peptidase [Atopococcus tabaci]
MDWILFVLVFYFGSCLASFLILVGMRVPRGESIVFPPSHCEACGHRLNATELFPILSFLWQKGRCRQCGISLPSLYFVLELSGGLSFCFIIVSFATDPDTSLALFLIWGFGIVLTASDVTSFLLPNSIMRGFFLSVLLFQFHSNRSLFFSSLSSGAGVFVLLYILYLLHPEGLGGGDVKLCGVLGVLLGYQATLFVIFLASLSGLAFSLRHRRTAARTTPLPFGPFLILGSFLTVALESVLLK